MKKSIKIATLAAVAALGLFLAAAAVLYAVVDTERVKTTLTDLVRERTGRELSFLGEVQLSVFPWLGVEMGPVSLSNAPGFGDGPFAEVRRTDVRVRLLPLLSKDVQFSGVTIDGLRLNLARDAKGRTNWQDLAGNPAKTPAQAAPEARPPDGGKDAGDAAGPLLAGLSVGGVRITDAGLTWADALNGRRCNLSGASLTTGPVALGAPFDFSFAARAEAAEPALAAEVQVSGRADPSQDLTRPRIDGLALSASADGAALPGGHVDVKVGGDILVDLGAGTINVQGLKLSALGMDVSGGLSVTRFDSDPVVDAALTFSEFNPRKLMAALGLPEIETTDPTALAKASGSIQATAGMDSARVRKLDFTVDGTTLTGSAGITHYAKPAIVFDLRAGTLDVNRYLPPPAGKAEAQGAPAQAGTATGQDAKPSSGLPKDKLRALDVDGKLRVGALTVHKLRFKDLDVTVKAKDGLLRISPLSVGLYDGNLKTSLTADMRSDLTRSALDLDLSGLRLGGLLTDLLGQDKVTGLASAQLKLSGQGEDWASLSRTLAGKGSARLTDGVFKGFQIIPDKVRKQAAAKDSGVATAKAEKQQPFQDISASFSVDKGIVSTGDASLTATGISATGQGRADLAREQIDTYAVVNMAALPNIPFSIKGDWADPEISLDTVAFLQETAKSIVGVPVNIGKGAGEVGGSIIKEGGKVLEGIGSGILDIFGGKSKKK